jgi:pimeloyl-ACP methyl ester carboxylesterase
MSVKPNILLVHGAWADGSGWSKVIPPLEKEGFNVTAAQLPLTSLSEDIAVARRLLSMQQGATLLVGHSYGGAVITGAANDAPQVTGLVYIAGWGVDEGESLEDLAKQGAPPAGAAQVYPDEYGFLWIKREGFAAAFAGDADPVEASVMAAAQKPLSVKSFTDKSGPAAWKHLPSWYLISGNDQMIPPKAEEFMARRMGATIRTVPASHTSMVSHPKEVVEIILLAATAPLAGRAAN